MLYAAFLPPARLPFGDAWLPAKLRAACCRPAAQACCVPVAMSLAGSRSLEELHAGAAFSRAAHPLELPEDGDSSMARLLQAVRRQPDPQGAVTTALVALLHVPSRPRLAFPTGRPSRKPAAAAAGEPEAMAGVVEEGAGAAGGTTPVGAKRKAPPEGGAGEAGEEERLPDADNYLEPFPAVSSLMDQFRRGGWRWWWDEGGGARGWSSCS